MGLPVDATLGEKIRFYRQQAGDICSKRLVNPLIFLWVMRTA